VRLAACAALALVSAGAQARPRYVLEHVVSLPGEGGWDYLTFDADAQRLFIAHGSHVDVVDTEPLQRTGEIPDTPGVHGIALAPQLGRGFISAGAANSLVEFDLKTLARLRAVRTSGDGPDAIVFEPTTQRVLTFNGRGRNASVFDARSLELLGTIALDARPEAAVADGRGRIFVNLEDKDSVAVLDAHALLVRAVWPLHGCEGPSGIAYNQDARQLYSACSNEVMVVTDAGDGHALGAARIGSGVDDAAYDADARLAFASCGEGVVTAVTQTSDGKPQVAQIIATQRGARTMALDARHHRLYLVTASFGATPPATAEHPRPRPAIEPGTFRLLVLGRMGEQGASSAAARTP
jgi:DNA-binding beta-propeller fold protein YncE